MKTELHELITRYHPGVIWFDGGWPTWWTDTDGRALYSWLRQQDPSLIINNRVNGAGDYGTPEQTIPTSAGGAGELWETCMTINNNWGFNKDDFNFKSAQDLVQKLCDIASKGGNFLLNVGPTAKGIIPAPEVDRLEAMGKWMDTNGACIYGTTRSPWSHPQFDGRVTTKGNELYLEVFNWPQGDLTLHGLKTRAISAEALDGGETLSMHQAGTDVTISRPSKIDDYATVVELKLAGQPEVEDIAPSESPNADGSFQLNASDAVIEGSKAHLESLNGPPSVGSWMDKSDIVKWTLDVPSAGSYSVQLDYACQDDSAGTLYAVRVKGTNSRVVGIVNGTGSWHDFKTMSLDGHLTLHAGKQILSVVPIIMPKGAVMNLRSIVLKPE
jgi:alpha-L-fucosidase